jgi:hypothetical protein
MSDPCRGQKQKMEELERKFNELEQKNKEMRKIIDEYKGITQPINNTKEELEKYIAAQQSHIGNLSNFTFGGRRKQKRK